MGHKTNPVGLRLQINRTWDSRWFAEGQSYQRLLKEDLTIRKFIVESLPQAAISKVVIERPAKVCRVSIYAARPGVIIGKKGADIEKLRLKLSKLTKSDVKLNIVEIRKPEIDAKLVAQGIAEIARVEWYREGRVPLHTLRANIDYAEAEAHTAYGVIGIKTWIFKGEILGHDPLAQDRLMLEAQTSGVRPSR